jgi:penicillin-binding protein 1A
MDDSEPNNISYKLTRSAGGLWEKFQLYWQRKWFRRAMVAVGFVMLGWLLLWALLLRNLPDAEALIEYQSPLPTIVRDINGEPFHSYARERRVQLDYADFKPLLIRSYLSAEDKTFFSHGGIDYIGILSAVFDNVFSSGRSRGASTITQQVAKNLLLTNEYSYTRKIKEAILAYRIEGALTKQQILSLYLNEIALGRQSFGVEAASQAYFGKSADELVLHEMAFLATLPKAPEKYSRDKYADAAMTRRNWVLGEMRSNGWITDAQLAEAKAQPLGLIPRQGQQYKNDGGYFAEEVRRQLIERFGETAEKGPYSVYAGGLWVRSSMNASYQELTTKALRDGLLRYHGGRGFSKPIATIPMNDGNWQARLASSNIGIDYSNWQIAVALGGGKLGFATGETGTLTASPAALKAGDVIAVAPVGGSAYQLRVVPEIGGGMVVQNAINGRVLAMQGGFDSRISSFNRATQAQRQPGSTIKPFVYATALDFGMTPTSILVDGPFCVYQSAALGQKCFKNFGGAGGAGPQTMRWGLEQSRNLMTVRAANDAGMSNVADTFRTMSIGDYPPYLSFALGAGDTTVLKMTNAYSMLVNQGRELKPTVIDYVQSRDGKVILPAKWKACEGCNAPEWNGKAMPRFRPGGKQIMDPVTAYQVVHMLEGVVQRGTATILRDLDRPLFGKTGTSSGPTNVWFVGGTPNVVAGVYMGFDQPRSLGGYAQGGSLAAPIFKQFARAAFAGTVALPFTAPNGVRLVRIDRKSGKRVYGSWPDDTDPKGAVIWEAFKAETEPKRSIRQDELTARGDKPKKKAVTQVNSDQAAQGNSGKQNSGSNKRDEEFLTKEGGIY